MKQKQDAKNKAGKIYALLAVGVAVLTGCLVLGINAKAQNATSTAVKTTTSVSQMAIGQTSTNTSSEPATSVPAPVTTGTTDAQAVTTTSSTTTTTTSSQEVGTPANTAPLNVPVAADSQAVDTAAPIPASARNSDVTNGNKVDAAAQGGAQGDVGGIGVPNYYAPKAETSEDEMARFPILFSLDFQTIYDDNIYISHSDRKADVIYRTTPKMVFETTRLEKWERRHTESKRSTTKVGEDSALSTADEQETQPENYLRASYAATWQKYNKYYTNDSLDHNAEVLYRHTSEKSLFEASQTFMTYNGPNVDVQGTLQQTTYGTRLFGSYALTGKTSIELEAVETMNRYDVGFNNNETAISPYINYEIAPKVTLGVGTIVDLLYIARGIDQTAIQPNLRLIYKYSEKLSFTSRFGLEVREFHGYDYERTSPMFAIGGLWTPFDHSTVKVDAYRRTLPAIGSANQDYDATGFSVLLKQEFLQKFYASLRGTYEYSTYFNAFDGTDSGRSQDYYTIRPTIGYTPNDMFTFNVYYQFSQNIASQDFNKFIDNQIGFQGSFSY